MNSYSVVQFITLIVYIILVAVVLRHEQTRLRNVFIVYLLASMTWSLSSFLNHVDFAWSQRFLWSKVIPFAALWTIIAYAQFVCAFVHTSARRVASLGYGLLLVVAVLIGLGYIPKRVLNLGDANVYNDYGVWLYLLTLGGACFVGTAIFLLVKSYRTSRSAEHRNRIIYLLVGVSFLVIFGALFEILPQQKYALDHLGHLGNAMVITYAILRYRLFDIKLVIRKGLVYSGITAFITTVYLIVLFSLYNALEGWAGGAGLIPVVALSALMAWLFSPLRELFQKGVDRIFYGARYDYRATVLSLSRRMSNVLDLGELAEAMLKPITKAVRASQASLLLPHDSQFVASYAERLTEGEPVIPVQLPKDSPIVTWLTRENKPLQKETIDLNAEFKALWESERRTLDAAEIELFCPMMSKGKLIGILALSRKQPRGFYSKDDTDLLMTVAHETAVTIENAQLYAGARERANIDELTGLFNHRYFHQRLDEEIARASRFGQVFSLILLDLDLFKIYNDVHGHLAGDEILRQAAQHIKLTIRRIDIGVRYGGDEFAVILPQTSIDGARVIAEKIHKRMETRTESLDVPLTCSIGVASWPENGIMREEIVRAADVALYYAKQTGRDRICLAANVALSGALNREAKPEAKVAVLSTIYALAATVDAKDHYTYGHSKKVAKYATEIAEALGYSEENIATIRAAALLHDIGKIGIADRVLEKAGPLTAKEWEPIRAHPNLGAAILKHVDGLRDCLASVQYHHERYDGTGYPSGLKGENIPLDARIMAVADAYDAMTSFRPYRRGRASHEQALAELKRCAGTQFDPAVVEAFTNLAAEPTALMAESEEETIPQVISP
jgi:diguanylate cyclase (GGDEF)-like protein/putative nucleotidyltransferase with HDIG domain